MNPDYWCMNGGCLAQVHEPNTYCRDCREKFNPPTPRFPVQINPPLEAGKRYLIRAEGSMWPATYSYAGRFRIEGQCISSGYTPSRAWVRLSDVLEAFEEVAP